MMTKLLPLLAAVLLLNGAASAQSTAASMLEPPVPDIVRLGFEAYQKDGVQAGLAIWLKGSPIQNDAAQVSNGLNTLQGLYGRLIGWESVRAVKISSSVRRVYAVAKLEHGPVYFRFDCYLASTDWTIPGIEMNTTAASILPPNILGGP